LLVATQILERTTNDISEEKRNRLDPEYADVQASIVKLLRAARAVSARSVNAIMTATY
jgi:hypothetical protein